MAGRGPAPKDPRRRARRNADPVGTTVIAFQRAERPDLPDDVDWPEQTRAWWDMWAESPLSEHFMSTDWSFLLDTARLHAEFWQGDAKAAAELRLRVAKFGATPEDRARLRIQFAEADGADGGPVRREGSARERRGVLVALPTPPDDAE